MIYDNLFKHGEHPSRFENGQWIPGLRSFERLGGFLTYGTGGAFTYHGFEDQFDGRICVGFEFGQTIGTATSRRTYRVRETRYGAIVLDGVEYSDGMVIRDMVTALPTAQQDMLQN